MSGTLANLADWAAGATARDVPSDVLALARAQNLAAAGTVRAARGTATGAALLAQGGGDAIAHAALLAYTNLDDYCLSGRTGLGAVPAGWTVAHGTTAELLAHTAIANEVAGRVGLALSLRHQPDRVDARVPAVASAVVRTRLAGGNGAAMATAVAGAISGTDGFDLPDAAGVSGALALARAVHQPHAASGDLAQLAGEGPVLPGALAGVGTRWLTRTLVIKRWPSTPWGDVALEAVNVILERHLRAAEKRLRADQIDRIELRTGFGPPCTEAAAINLPAPSAAAWSVAEATAVLVALHELGPALLEAGAMGDKEADARALVPRVSVMHQWKLSAREAVATARALGPVLGEAGVATVLRAGQRLVIGRPSADEIVPLLQERPWAMLGPLRKSGDLSDVNIDGYVHCFPVDVKLYTTRGGWWPERRQAPVGQGSGAAGVAVARYGEGGQALLDANDLGEPATAFVKALLS